LPPLGIVPKGSLGEISLCLQGEFVAIIKTKLKA